MPRCLKLPAWGLRVAKRRGKVHHFALWVAPLAGGKWKPVTNGHACKIVVHLISPRNIDHGVKAV